MEEKFYLPYILHNLGSPLGCSDSLFGSFKWFLRVVQIIPYRGKELFERAIKTILTNDKCHLFPNNGRLLCNNGRLFCNNGGLLGYNGREMEDTNFSSISELKTNKGVLRDLWKMEEKKTFYLAIQCAFVSQNRRSLDPFL